MINTAARLASGMRFNSAGIATTHTTSSAPWMNDDHRVRAPAYTFAELRTITAVTGRPPSMPAAMLPTPCAMSSRLGSEIRRCGSILSEASSESRDSMLATTASVIAVEYT